MCGLFFMKDFPLDLQALHKFSESSPYALEKRQYSDLYDKLQQLRIDLRFPAVTNDVGGLLSLLVRLKAPRNILEFGSGYGHSAFWYLISNHRAQNIYLTEKRVDLIKYFDQLPWPSDFKQSMHYHQGDAFLYADNLSDIDFVLIDGQKTDYLRFLDIITPKLSPGALVAIDNSYWRGSFLDTSEVAKHQAAMHIKLMHEHIKENQTWFSIFMPYKDGVTILHRS